MWIPSSASRNLPSTRYGATSKGKPINSSREGHSISRINYWKRLVRGTGANPASINPTSQQCGELPHCGDFGVENDAKTSAMRKSSALFGLLAPPAAGHPPVIRLMPPSRSRVATGNGPAARLELTALAHRPVVVCAYVCRGGVYVAQRAADNFRSAECGELVIAEIARSANDRNSDIDSRIQMKSPERSHGPAQVARKSRELVSYPVGILQLGPPCSATRESISHCARRKSPGRILLLRNRPMLTCSTVCWIRRGNGRGTRSP